MTVDRSRTQNRPLWNIPNDTGCIPDRLHWQSCIAVFPLGNSLASLQWETKVVETLRSLSNDDDDFEDDA